MSSYKEFLLTLGFKRFLSVGSLQLHFHLALYQESKEVIVNGREKPLLELTTGRSRLAFKIDNGVLSGELLLEFIK